MKSLAVRLFGCCLFLAALVPARGQVYTWTNAFPGLVFSNALSIASPPGEANRRFIVEKHARIIVITNLANPTRTVFMDLSDRVSVASPGEYADRFNEEGTLSMAFHPDYANNGYFYVFYTGPATNGTLELHDIVSRFKVSASDPNRGDPDSELRLI